MKVNKISPSRWRKEDIFELRDRSAKETELILATVCLIVRVYFVPEMIVKSLQLFYNKRLNCTKVS